MLFRSSVSSTASLAALIAASEAVEDTEAGEVAGFTDADESEVENG